MLAGGRSIDIGNVEGATVARCASSRRRCRWCNGGRNTLRSSIGRGGKSKNSECGLHLEGCVVWNVGEVTMEEEVGIICTGTMM